MALQDLLSGQSPPHTANTSSLEHLSVACTKAGVPYATRLSLPTEILDTILRFVPKADLLAASRASKAFHDVAIPVLYHTIDELKPVPSVRMLIRLDREPRLHHLVRKLSIDWTSPPPPLEPTRNLYLLLQRVLRKLKRLTSLSIELPRTGNPIWILEGCTFSLRYFSTSMPCDEQLARYLDSQTSLTELTLRGYQQGVNILPSFLGLTAVETGCTFNLQPTSLPKLMALRTVHGGPSIIASVVEGRPISTASIALFPSTSSNSLNALSLSAVPMRRLSIMSFDPAVQDYLLADLAERFPHLEALHIVILLTEFTDYITFMAATDRVALPEEEQAIAKIWHRSCPSLKTIILPRGKVWFSEGQSEWNTLDTDEDSD
ncbi:hypothetical protein H0H92_008676 [Tricholoma furcatifolium]|nr:hypothetical protein H0H92_008676 [Tricholoma furcatifolium]